MTESIKFRFSQNEFQKKLKENIKLINSSKNIFLSAEKHTNFMKSRKKIIHENVIKTYKKADMSLPKKISRKTKKL